MKSADLYFTGGGSDKEYHVKIEKEGSGYVVNVAYGRRGGTMVTGPKTTSLVSLEEAEVIFDKTVHEKMAKGYTGSGAAAQPVVLQKVGIGKLTPMLCEKFTPAEASRLGEGWVVERKLDGVRAYIEGGKLFDRRSKDITKQFPEFTGLDKLPTLDGEIVAKSGEFNDVSGRMHMRDKFQIKLCAQTQPAIFVAFDAPRVKGDVNQRRSAMAGMTLPSWMEIVKRFKTFEEGWSEVQEHGWEGLIMKKEESLYQEGVRSKEWRKVKAFEETTAVFTKLADHPRGVRLETADGRSVNVNGAQAEEVTRIFKEKGKVVGEVQYLPQSDSDAWRFPSWRGLKEVNEVSGSRGWVRVGRR